MAIVRGHVAYLLDQVGGKTLGDAGEVLEIGVITVLPEEIRWQSDTLPDHEKHIPISKVVTVEEKPKRVDPQRTEPCVILDTVEHTYTFVCGENSDISSKELVRAIRQAMDLQFISTDEVTFGTRPRRFRGTAGPHVVLAVSDLSWGEEAGKKPIKVEVSTLNAPFSWKRRLFLAEDVHNHLQQGFNDLIAQAMLGTEIADRCRDLGALLLHNTISARAISELSKLVPSLVTLRVDDLLVHFPWGIIHDGKQYVLLDYAVAQQISTIGIMDLHRETATFSRRRMLILSNPTLDLPGTQSEANRLIAGLEEVELDPTWTVVHLTGNQVTRVAIMTALSSGRYEIIHYAGHAQFDPANPDASVWVLHDGSLSATEIQQNVEGNPPSLVYASACEAGREDIWASLSYRRQLHGLASAFLQGGVGNYIGGFWPIPDRDSPALAAYFYGHFLRGTPVAEAMRRAKSRLAASGSDPLLWGGITLFGDPSTQLSAST